MDLNLNILVISLNINRLNVPIKIKGYQVGYFYRNIDREGIHPFAQLPLGFNPLTTWKADLIAGMAVINSQAGG